MGTFLVDGMLWLEITWSVKRDSWGQTRTCFREKTQQLIGPEQSVLWLESVEPRRVMVLVVVEWVQK